MVFYQAVSQDSLHCVKSVRIRSYSGPHFPAFGLNTERYKVSLRIHSKCGKMRTKRTPNTYTFHAVLISEKLPFIADLLELLHRRENLVRIAFLKSHAKYD